MDEDFNVRVADFGLSRVTHDLNTLTGGLGTFQYMAPEVMANQRYSVKADVYSFGVVLWECTARQVSYLLTFQVPPCQFIFFYMLFSPQIRCGAADMQRQPSSLPCLKLSGTSKPVTRCRETSLCRCWWWCQERDPHSIADQTES